MLPNKQIQENGGKLLEMNNVMFGFEYTVTDLNISRGETWKLFK